MDSIVEVDKVELSRNTVWCELQRAMPCRRQGLDIYRALAFQIGHQPLIAKIDTLITGLELRHACPFCKL